MLGEQLNDFAEFRPFQIFFVPTGDHQFVQNVRTTLDEKGKVIVLICTHRHWTTYHRWWKTEGILDRFDHILIGPVPERSFTKRDDFPAENTETPHIGCWRKFAIVDRFDRRPTDGDFAPFRRVTIAFVDFSAQTEIGYFTDQLFVDKNISCREILEGDTRMIGCDCVFPYSMHIFHIR